VQVCLEGIESLLIMPVQRVPRYKMLLESLIKYTPDEDPERPRLQQVCAPRPDHVTMAAGALNCTGLLLILKVVSIAGARGEGTGTGSCCDARCTGP
jgi:hypothetical protein